MFGVYQEESVQMTIKIDGIDTYFGGKSGSGVYQKIINQIRPHNQLIIPFLGNCGVTRNIRRSDITIGIDISSFVVEKWKQADHTGIIVENGDSIEFLESHLFYNGDTGSRTVIYADPPYPMDSRKSQKEIYENELSDDDHIKLLTNLKKQKCDVLISTYENDMYKDMLSEWRCITFQATTRRGLATEYLYMNYVEPTELHDYSFLGEDFRERERIRKKIKRHTDRLMQLPELERKAILENLIEASSNDKNDDGVLLSKMMH